MAPKTEDIPQDANEHCPVCYEYIFYLMENN